MRNIAQPIGIVAYGHMIALTNYKPALNQFFTLCFYHNLNRFHYESTNRAGDHSPHYVSRYISISALNALPGLAVSPILGDLNKIFPSATDLEIQMLSSLPSLLIIPFILLSGKLTEKVNNLCCCR